MGGRARLCSCSSCCYSSSSLFLSMLFLLDAPARAQRPCQIFPDRCLCRRPLEISLQNLGSKPKWKTPTSPKGRRKASMAKVRCGRDRTKPSMGCYHYIGDDYDLMIAPNAWHDGSRGSGRRRWTEINFSGNCCKLKNWNSLKKRCEKRFRNIINLCIWVYLHIVHKHYEHCSCDLHNPQR